MRKADAHTSKRHSNSQTYLNLLNTFFQNSKIKKKNPKLIRKIQENKLNATKTDELCSGHSKQLETSSSQNLTSLKFTEKPSAVAPNHTRFNVSILCQNLQRRRKIITDFIQRKYSRSFYFYLKKYTHNNHELQTHDVCVTSARQTVIKIVIKHTTFDCGCTSHRLDIPKRVLSPSPLESCKIPKTFRNQSCRKASIARG